MRNIIYTLLPICILGIAGNCFAADTNLIQALEKRLQILEDKEQIRTLIQSYGRYVDDRNWKSFANLFATDGGTWDGGMGVATGHTEIIEMMDSTLGTTNSDNSGLSNLHLLSNEIISIDGDTATALSKWVFVMTGDSGEPNVAFIGQYNDQLIRENGHWKFKYRKVSSDISAPINLDNAN